MDNRNALSTRRNNRMSRNMNHMLEPTADSRERIRPVPEGCICQRPYAPVLCTICAYQFRGRVRTVCPAHPKIIYLMDLDRCPKCLAYSHMLKEFPNN